MTARLGAARFDFFTDNPLAQRLSALDQFQQDGLQPRLYAQALRRSVAAWLPIEFAIRQKN